MTRKQTNTSPWRALSPLRAAFAAALATAAASEAAMNGVVYENDFSQRRSAWAVNGATAAAYEATGLVTNRVESEVYLLENATNLTARATGTHATLQPIGMDGWRRTGYNTDLGAMEAVVRRDTDFTFLRFIGEEGKFAFFAHPLGSSFTSGKVRLSVDARLATSWGQSGVAWVTLGDEAYYFATPGDAKNHRYTAVGIRGTANTPTYLETEGSQNPQPATPISAGHWYRIVVTADLDSGLAEYRLFEQGESYPNSTTPDGTEIYFNSQIARLNGTTSVSCYSLGVFNKTVYFDNVKAWHCPTGSSEETLIYENYFSSRTCYFQNLRESRLVGTAANPASIDGWERLSTTTDRILLVGGANPAIGFNAVGEGGSAYAAHFLGGLLKNGTMTTRFDMLAPSAWGASGQAYIWLGGERYRGVGLNPSEGQFYEWGAVGAGCAGGAFAAYSGNGNGGGGYTTSGTAIPGHWYRFVVKSDVIRNGKSDVDVFDMGTAQPSLDTPTPASGAVASFPALPFRKSAAALGGVSCVAVQARGVKAANPLVLSETRLLIDNIVMEFHPVALVMVVR